MSFDPLATMPSDLPESQKRYYAKLAEKAPTQYRSAVKLKCLECCAWDRGEVKRCEVSGCPLWAMNRRIFG